jgi:hypothetical protein
MPAGVSRRLVERRKDTGNNEISKHHRKKTRCFALRVARAYVWAGSNKLCSTASRRGYAAVQAAKTPFLAAGKARRGIEKIACDFFQ